MARTYGKELGHCEGKGLRLVPDALALCKEHSFRILRNDDYFQSYYIDYRIIMSAIKQAFYLPFWWFRAKFFGRTAPLQSVIFISDRCNLSCKHCSVYNHKAPVSKTYEQIREELIYCYGLGSRFIDFEGGEPFLWEDKNHLIDSRPANVNDLCDLAHSLGFYSCTITTNAQKAFAGSHADSIWVSMDGVGAYHDTIRGEGTFARLEKNASESGCKHLSANMAINVHNADSVAAAIEYVKEKPYFESISLNFHTPFPGTEHLALPMEKRNRIIDLILDYKKKGYPIMNSKSGLKAMKSNKFKKRCWMTNFIYVDGTREPQCAGYKIPGLCDKCGFCMAGEEDAVMRLAPDTILAGFKLRR